MTQSDWIGSERSIPNLPHQHNFNKQVAVNVRLKKHRWCNLFFCNKVWICIQNLIYWLLQGIINNFHKYSMKILKFWDFWRKMWRNFFYVKRTFSKGTKKVHAYQVGISIELTFNWWIYGMAFQLWISDVNFVRPFSRKWLKRAR